MFFMSLAISGGTWPMASSQDRFRRRGLPSSPVSSISTSPSSAMASTMEGSTSGVGAASVAGASASAWAAWASAKTVSATDW